MVAAPDARMLSRAHDIHPYFQHPQLAIVAHIDQWQIDAGRPPDPDHRGLQAREMKEQVLDSMYTSASAASPSRRRTVRLTYPAKDGKTYIPST